MRFVCDHCDSKYSIADEKVRNKVLKIRCRKCGEIIEVRDPARASKGAPPKRATSRDTARKGGLESKFADSFRAGAKREGGTPGLFAAVKRSAETLEQHEADILHWFAAVDGDPTGPISARGVHALREQGKVDDDSLVWKEGFPDWTKLRNCKELVGLLATIDLEADTAPAGAPDAVEDDDKRLGLFKEPAGPDTDQSPLKGRSVGVIAERMDAVGEALDAAAVAGGDEAAPDEKPKAPEPTPGPKPAKGAVGASVSDLGSFEKLSKELDSQIAPVSSIRPPQPVQGRVVKLAAVGFFFAAVAVLAFVLGGGGSVETKIVETIKEVPVYRDRIVEVEAPLSRGGRSSVKVDEGGDQVAAANPQRPRRGGKPKAKKDDDSEKTRRLLEQMGMAGSGSGVDLGDAPTKKTSSAGGRSAASQLTASQVLAVKNKNAAGMKACYERALKQGEAPADQDVRVNFKLTVTPSGMVKSPQLSGAGAKIGSLKKCLERSVKRWVFPTSSSSSPVEFSFLFTPK